MAETGGHQRDPILRTKLHRPTVAGDLVCRQRLHQRMHEGRLRPLTLVSAPAGYGKSMLVSHWAESLDHPCAWVSLDQTDGELEQFLAYVLAAVQMVFPESCRETATLLQAAHLPPVSALARNLTNELDVLDTPFVLVLDDYHRIAPSSSVHELLTRLLEHPPQPLRLILTTRRDPPLPLLKLRAGKHMTELRLQDLRFTGPESAELLAKTAKNTLSEDALANLQHELEGWAVGLHLVSMTLIPLLVTCTGASLTPRSTCSGRCCPGSRPRFATAYSNPPSSTASVRRSSRQSASPMRPRRRRGSAAGSSWT